MATFHTRGDLAKAEQLFPRTKRFQLIYPLRASSRSDPANFLPNLTLLQNFLGCLAPCFITEVCSSQKSTSFLFDMLSAGPQLKERYVHTCRESFMTRLKSDEPVKT
jgi:hypothetical protein